MSAMSVVLTHLPLALDFSALSDQEFLAGVGVIAGIYFLVALGLQLNVGYTGITNFGQAGFMAVGAYTMAILVLKAGFSFWLSLPLAVGAAVVFGLIIGLPSLRLRADYFAIATIAMAEVVRLFAQNARGLTGGNQGLFCNSSGACYDDAWRNVSNSINDFLQNLGWNGTDPTNSWSQPDALMPLLIVVWVTAVLVAAGLTYVTKTPWGRVLRAVREDEDAARALGKNTLAYKLQSLAISGAIGAIAGFFLALDLATVHPEDYEPLVTFFAYGVLILGGLASYWGVAVGSLIFWVVLEGTRFVSLPDPPFTETRIAALRFAIVGLVLILLMAFRPQGMFGKKEEMVLGE
jgi:branched-chain amino acid transport system permease protein